MPLFSRSNQFDAAHAVARPAAPGASSNPDRVPAGEPAPIDEPPADKHPPRKEPPAKRPPADDPPPDPDGDLPREHPPIGDPPDPQRQA